MYTTTKPYLEDVKDLIRSTWSNNELLSVKGDGSFIKRFGEYEVDHTDGVGTKGIYHWQQRTFDYAVLDAMAMNLNDLAMMRAEPYKMQSHIMVPKEDKDALISIFNSMANWCKVYNIVLTGGETAIHDNMEGLEISITMSGRVLDHTPNQFQIGDCLIAFPSNGLHSNGFTRVRKAFHPYESYYISNAVRPTRVYYPTIKSLMGKINGMMHITGGGFAKLKRALPENADVVVSHKTTQKVSEIFDQLYEKRGVSDREMYTTFNCGVGFMISVSPKDVHAVLSVCQDAFQIGFITGGSGKVVIDSVFSNKTIEV
jgi:phosphoribosylformylglycinamidine cyclo-ligase